LVVCLRVERRCVSVALVVTTTSTATTTTSTAIEPTMVLLRSVELRNYGDSTTEEII